MKTDSTMSMWRWALLIVLALVILALYHPVLGFQLTGDDYQWVQFAHRAQHQPHLLFADLSSFYRPASTWTLVGDRCLWGWNPMGFHATNLVLHGLSAFLLALLAVRLGLNRLIATAISLIWATSVFASEPAISVAIRFQNLLLIGWFILFVSWPRGDEEWTPARRFIAGAAVVLLFFSKETWVTTPALLLVLDRVQRGPGWKRTIRSVMPVALLACAYVLIYFLVFPSDKNYYDFVPSTLLKVPHMFAAFLHTIPLRPMGFEAHYTDLFAVIFVIAAGFVCLRYLLGAGLLGFTLIIASMLPTLMVPYLPIRYTSIPYAGFLLITGAIIERGLAAIDARPRKLAAIGLTVFATLFAAIGFFAVQVELLDWKEVSDHHHRLLKETRQIIDSIPLDQALVVIRAEHSEPLMQLAKAPHGLPKVWFYRGNYPYGLIDLAALFEWTLEREDLRFENINAPPGPAVVLVHHEGGFEYSDRIDDAAKETLKWRANGVRLGIVEAKVAKPQPKPERRIVD